MQLRRNPLTIAVFAAALGLMAACSDEKAAPSDAPPAQSTPAPSSTPSTPTPPADSPSSVPAPTTPAPSTPAPSEGTPGSSVPGTTMPSDPSAPPAGTDPSSTTPSTTPSSPSSSISPNLGERLALSGQALQSSAISAAQAVGEKAGEIKVAASRRMTRMGDAIRQGAARADAAIQESLDHGGRPTQNQPAVNAPSRGTQIASGS